MHLAADDGDFELEKLHVTLKSFYLQRFVRKGIKKRGSGEGVFALTYARAKLKEAAGVTTLEQDGEVIATGATAAVLGTPIHSLVNLVNKLAEFDIGLSAGDFVIPGTPHPAVPPVAGSCYRATFDRCGYVKVHFTD